jgi:hypothetical protein
MMRQLTLATAALVAASAFAQQPTTPEAYPPSSPPSVVQPKATAVEKGAGNVAGKDSGREAARTEKTGDAPSAIPAAA